MHGGIGDVLLWLPALKFMKVKPDVLYLYGTPELELLKLNGLVNEAFHAKNKLQLLKFQLKKRGFYDNVFLNHLCGGSFLLKIMSMCSVTVISNSSHFKGASKNFIHRTPESNIHDAKQNYLLLHGRIPVLESSSFELTMPSFDLAFTKEKFIAVHIADAAKQTPYKNWPIKHWQKMIDLLLKVYPDYKFVFLGSAQEIEFIDQLNLEQSKFISLAGKTNLTQAGAVLSKASVLIGSDSGIMHLAVCAGTPTFSIWGGSSEVLYSYHEIAPTRHKIVNIKAACAPCNAWLNPNTTKTDDPLKCPDFSCMIELKPEFAFEQFKTFFKF